MRIALLVSLFLHGGVALWAGRGGFVAASPSRPLENGVAVTVSWSSRQEVPRLELPAMPEANGNAMPVPQAALDAIVDEAVAEIAADLQAMVDAPVDIATLGIALAERDAVPAHLPLPNLDIADVVPSRLFRRVPSASPQQATSTTPTVAPLAAAAALPPPPSILTPDPGTNAPPVYPPAAKRRGQQGTVVVRFTCDERGVVTQAEVFRTSGFALLDEAALTAVSRWRFHGGPGQGEQLVEFRLDLANPTKSIPSD